MYTMGINKRHAKYIRYMLNMLDGASDHLTKMAAKDIAIIEMVSSNPTFLFIFPPPIVIESL